MIPVLLYLPPCSMYINNTVFNLMYSLSCGCGWRVGEVRSSYRSWFFFILCIAQSLSVNLQDRLIFPLGSVCLLWGVVKWWEQSPYWSLLGFFVFLILADVSFSPPVGTWTIFNFSYCNSYMILSILIILHFSSSNVSISGATLWIKTVGLLMTCILS